MTDFHINQLERQFAFLDTIPEQYIELVLRQISGTLEERTAAVGLLRTSLLQGRLPQADRLPWPPKPLPEEILRFLDAMDFPPLCKDQPEIVDQLVPDILEKIVEMEADLPIRIEEAFRNLQAIAEERAASHSNDQPIVKRQLQPLAEQNLKDEMLNELREHAEFRAREESAETLIQALGDDWRERVEAWKQILEVFGTFSGLLGRGLDYARALVRSQGWADIARHRALMERLPELQELIETLGRMQFSEDDDPTTIETIFESIGQRHESYEEIRTPLAPMETRGIRRSNDISRLLPVEAANLTQPRLRTLFYARMHEHALATYLVDGVMAERIESEEDLEQSREQEVEQPPEKRGPIIACLDTSGSMHGAPETVAKALVLEALRVGHRENRPCYLITFSGPDQIETLELSLERDNLTELMKFLGRSFHGGTDLVAPINQAIDLLESDNWNKADILLVSDGVFSVPDDLQTDLDRLRDDIGLQVHGVLVANYDRGSMAQLCDELHEFQQWEGLAH